MQTIKNIFKKIVKMPKVHIGGIVIVGIVIYAYTNFLSGDMNPQMFKSTLIKAIVLLVMIYAIYFAHVLVFSEAKESDENDEKPKSTFVPNPGPPAPKPDHYGTNIKVNVGSVADERKAQEIKAAIERFNAEKSRPTEYKVALPPDESKPAMAVRDQAAGGSSEEK